MDSQNLGFALSLERYKENLNITPRPMCFGEKLFKSINQVNGLNLLNHWEYQFSFSYNRAVVFKHLLEEKDAKKLKDAANMQLINFKPPEVDLCASANFIQNFYQLKAAIIRSFNRDSFNRRVDSTRITKYDTKSTVTIKINDLWEAARIGGISEDEVRKKIRESPNLFSGIRNEGELRHLWAWDKKDLPSAIDHIILEVNKSR